MTELDEILAGMDPALFNESAESSSFEMNPEDDKESYAYVSEHYDSSKVIHQENIPNEMACALLLPNQYDASCRYQLVTMREKTILLKINDRYAPDTEHIQDYTIDNVDVRYMEEFELETNDSVQTYQEMLQAIVIPPVDRYEEKISYDIYDRKRSHWWLVPAIVFVLLLLIGCGIFYFLLKMF